MSVRRSLFVLLVITLALPLVAFGVKANRAQTSADSAPQVQQTIVGQGDVEVVVSAIGTMQPDQRAAISFMLPGRITDIPVTVGQVVTAGDVLMQQADDSLRIAYEQAALALNTTEIQRDDVLDGADAGQITIAQANIDAARGAVAAIQNAVSPADIQTAQLSYQRALDALTAAQDARATASGGQSQAYYDLLDAQIGEAGFNAEIARLNLERLRTGNPSAVGAASARVEQAQAQLDQLLAGPSQAEIDRAETAVERARIDLERAQTAWDRTRIIAPFDGIVTVIDAEIGALVAPGLAVIEITDMNPLHLTVQVDEIDVRQVVEGMPARVKLDALPDLELPAEVETLSLVATNNGGVVSYEVLIRVDQEDSRLRVGMTAEANIVIESQSDVLIVPNQYIRLDRTRTSAFVNLLEADGTLREIPVTLGLQGQDVSQVIDGLREGDVIAIDLSGDELSIFGG